jgi:hypothetical protein
MVALLRIGFVHSANLPLPGLFDLRQLFEQLTDTVRQRLRHHIRPCDAQAQGDKVVGCQNEERDAGRRNVEGSLPQSAERPTPRIALLRTAPKPAQLYSKLPHANHRDPQIARRNTPTTREPQRVDRKPETTFI